MDHSVCFSMIVIYIREKVNINNGNFATKKTFGMRGWYPSRHESREARSRCDLRIGLRREVVAVCQNFQTD